MILSTKLKYTLFPWKNDNVYNIYETKIKDCYYLLAISFSSFHSNEVYFSCTNSNVQGTELYTCIVLLK